MHLSANSTYLDEVIAKKAIFPETVEETAQSLKEEGKTIATLNGSFDLLHPGHLQTICEASKQGDILWMLLNTDASIQKNKGPTRPINPMSIRLLHLACLEGVRFVSWFEETTPISILEKIKPDVHVNGSDYGEDCIEAPIVKKHGGKIHIVKLVHGYSTSNLIKKIQSICA